MWVETSVQIDLQEIQMVLDKLRDIISTNLFARNSNDLIMAILELDFFFVEKLLGIQILNSTCSFKILFCSFH